MILYAYQTIEDSDIKAVAGILRSDFLTEGPTVDASERAIAERVEARHAVAFANGTIAPSAEASRAHVIRTLYDAADELGLSS
jgi:dTDP-4-amino-4,6-dideoxygalactose transaminase